MNTKELVSMARHLFEKKMPLQQLHQEIAENFYPERADFTMSRYLGDEYAGNLMTSYPILCRRDLGDSIGTMLRDTRKPWFEMISNARAEDNDARAWLQFATAQMRKAIYDTRANFSKYAKQGDHDFAAFGQNVIRVRPNSEMNGLMFRCYHLRDMAWAEDEDGQICFVVRKSKIKARDLALTFNKTAFRKNNSVHPNVTKLAKDKPFNEVECFHLIVKSDMTDIDYGKGANEKPWCSIWFDCDNSHEMEAIAQWNKEYVISRWVTLGSQYATSPAVIAALPEARLLQAMTYTLLTAGEKVVNPAVVATEQAVRSDVDLRSGGITWVSYDYDERQGAALRQISTDVKGIPIGREMQGDSRQLLAQCFFLNKLKPFVPTQDPTMTAFQAGQIVAQYVRDALPLFEPMEAEYNGGICDEVFDVMKRMNAFGPIDDIPPQLRGAEIRFRFQSPLHDAIDAQKGQKFLEMVQIVSQAISLDQSSAMVPNATDALRDALSGISVPAKWLNSEAEVMKMKADQEKMRQAQQAIAQLSGGADVAQKLGGAMKDVSQAQGGQVA